MKIHLINASPKFVQSNTQLSLELFTKLIDSKHECSQFFLRKPEIAPQDIQTIIDCDVIIIFFPLYYDALPSHFVSCLEDLEKAFLAAATRAKGQCESPSVFAVGNCGFFEGIQIKLAFEILENWADRAGLRWGGGVGIGGGGMLPSVKNVPLGVGPLTSIGLALKQQYKAVEKDELGKNKFVEPNFPRFLYKLIAELSWRSELKKNGLPAKELNRKIMIRG